MLKAIFFATFDVTEGPKVLHQVPTSSVTASPSSPSIPLIHFPPISSLLIPHPTLCNSGLLTLTHSHHRILSYPQHIASPSYPRNAYTFNFCLVLAEDAQFSSYIPVVRKLNTLFRTLEEQSQFLSRDGGSAPDSGKIYALCEILLEDLNNYSEAMIPIDASNTLNIKLFPTYPPPPPLYAHHVPLATVRLEDLVDENWDLTMLRVLPWIDGVNSVKQIALLADADLKLVRKAIRHLLYYGCVLLLDIFSFGAIYAPTAEVAAFVESKEMQAECARYVALQSETDERSGSAAKEEELQKKKMMNNNLSGAQLAELYLSLRQGLSVKSWCAEHADAVSKMDIRRFVTFGVIKGFLYRVHKYAYATTTTTTTSTISTANNPNPNNPNRSTSSPFPPSKKKKEMNEKSSRANLYRTELTKRKQKNSRNDDDEEDDKAHVDKGGDGEPPGPDLARYLDGTHCFDEMCTDLMVGERELTARLKAWGDVQVVCR